MTPQEIEKRYRREVRKSHPRSGATWQRVKELKAPSYWNHVELQGSPGEDKEYSENTEANPDNLGFKSKGDVQSMMREAEHSEDITVRVRKLLDLAKQMLTGQQYNVFIMLAVKEPHLTERETAKVLGVTPGRVHQLWVKAQIKLQRAFNERT